jgi:hypothetical protein
LHYTIFAVISLKVPTPAEYRLIGLRFEFSNDHKQLNHRRISKLVCQALRGFSEDSSTKLCPKIDPSGMSEFLATNRGEMSLVD